eukprot:322561-Chlamydomonas_euryale.AAC.8
MKPSAGRAPAQVRGSCQSLRHARQRPLQALCKICVRRDRGSRDVIPGQARTWASQTGGGLCSKNARFTSVVCGGKLFQLQVFHNRHGGVLATVPNRQRIQDRRIPAACSTHQPAESAQNSRGSPRCLPAAAAPSPSSADQPHPAREQAHIMATPWMLAASALCINSLARGSSRLLPAALSLPGPTGSPMPLSAHALHERTMCATQLHTQHMECSRHVLTVSSLAMLSLDASLMQRKPNHKPRPCGAGMQATRRNSILSWLLCGTGQKRVENVSWQRWCAPTGCGRCPRLAIARRVQGRGQCVRDCPYSTLGSQPMDASGAACL